jgi:uncharacterized protein YjbI with pentapeptide repeats
LLAEMANKEHLDILAKGVEAWNAWRKQNREVHPDLCGLDWTSNSGGLLLNYMDLSGVSLRGAKLHEARLIQADFREAVLDYADLSSAQLFGADFAGSTLDNTNFEEANLHVAKFQSLTFSGANLNRASLGFTTLINVDLSTRMA